MQTVGIAGSSCREQIYVMLFRLAIELYS